MTIFGYARCSTDESKQDINRQIRELKQMGATTETIYFEYESGSKEDRVEFNRMLKELKTNDTIVATEVSRISRSTKQLCEIVELAKKMKLKLVIKDFVLDCTGEEIDPMAKAMLSMMGVFAELEKDMISQRVKSGMANAKAKGKHVGRPQIKADDVPESFKEYYKMFKDGIINKTELMKLTQLSRSTVYRYCNKLEGK